jgi:hypothetical protein
MTDDPERPDHSLRAQAIQVTAMSSGAKAYMCTFSAIQTIIRRPLFLLVDRRHATSG